MRVLEICLSLLLVGFGLFAAFEASKLRTPAGSLTQDILGPGFFPFWLGVGVGGLAAVGLVDLLLRHRDDAPFLEPGSRTAVAVVGVATVAYVLAVGVFGFIVATFVFVAGTLVALRQSLAVSTLAAVVVTGGLYLLFARWLQVPLPAGLFGF